MRASTSVRVVLAEVVAQQQAAHVGEEDAGEAQRGQCRLEGGRAGTLLAGRAVVPVVVVVVTAELRPAASRPSPACACACSSTLVSCRGDSDGGGAVRRFAGKTPSSWFEAASRLRRGVGRAMRMSGRPCCGGGARKVMWGSALRVRGRGVCGAPSWAVRLAPTNSRALWRSSDTGRFGSLRWTKVR